MKSIRLADVLGVLVLGVFLVYSAAWLTAAAPKEGAFQSKELTFESDGKKIKEQRLKAIREKRMREQKPPTEAERKKRQQEGISKKYQGMIQQQEAVAARWMKIRGLAQQEKAVLTVKEIDKLITEQREIFIPGFRQGALGVHLGEFESGFGFSPFVVRQFIDEILNLPALDRPLGHQVDKLYRVAESEHS